MLSTRARETATTHSRPAPAQNAAAMAAPWICRQDRRCQGSEQRAARDKAGSSSSAAERRSPACATQGWPPAYPGCVSPPQLPRAHPATRPWLRWMKARRGIVTARRWRCASAIRARPATHQFSPRTLKRGCNSFPSVAVARFRQRAISMRRHLAFALLAPLAEGWGASQVCRAC